jgi:Right handed beta helix region
MSMTSAKGLVALMAAVVALSPGGASVPRRAAAPVPAGCARFASPNGNDGAPGSFRSPVRTAQHLADTLRAGQTGCLEAGIYAGYLRITHGGHSGAPIVIRSLPGAAVTLRGRVWVRSGSDHVTIAGVHIEGAACGRADCPNVPTVAINGASTTLSHDDITNHHSSICVAVGSDVWGVAHGTVIAADVIHDCGRLPATNLEHGIYIADSVGAVVSSNYIYDNADRGVQIYPHADRTIVERNVIDGNGEGILIGGTGSDPSFGSLIEHNLITNSRRGANVESWFPDGPPPSRANRVLANCLYGGQVSPTLGGVVLSGGGVSASHNLIADPGYQPSVPTDRELPVDPAASMSLAPAVGGLCATFLQRAALPRARVAAHHRPIRSARRRGPARASSDR